MSTVRQRQSNSTVDPAPAADTFKVEVSNITITIAIALEQVALGCNLTISTNHTIPIAWGSKLKKGGHFLNQGINY